MSNASTFAGYEFLPTQSITGTAETALLVPTDGTKGLGLPSPQLPASSGLTVSFPNDILLTSYADGHPFIVRVAGRFNNTGAGNLTVKLYQVPFSNLGTISATGSVTSAGAPGSGDTAVSSVAFTTPASGHFWIENVLTWDSVVAKLDGWTIGAVNNTALAQTAVTQLTTGVATVSQLNFLPSFTFATANAANAISLTEFVIDRR